MTSILPLRAGLLAALAIACLGAASPLPATAAAGQSYASEHGPVRVTELVTGLRHPWALAVLPGNQGVLITERPGFLRLASPSGELGGPIEGLPRVYAHIQGGLLDVALSPDFDSDRRVYLAYAEAGANERAGTAVGYGVLSPDQSRLEDFTVVFRQEPKLSSGQHFGARLVFDGRGHLFIALGDNNQLSTPQDLGKLQGKLVRIRPDGGIPPDNPFAGRPDAGRPDIRPEIWSYGHRNQQGAALHPASGQLWTHEHGPQGGDEINTPMPGKNYGWPLATHGVDYGGQPVREARGNAAAGTEPPTYVWSKSPAISGMAFYTASRFAPWQGNLFIGALKAQELIRLELDGDKVVHEERLLGERNERIRDVRPAPDGGLYLLTDSANGKLLKLDPP